MNDLTPDLAPNSLAAADVAVAHSTEDASAAGELVYLPLHRLELDADNVRKRGGDNVDALKALILAQDLLQNLVVCPLLTKRGKATGKYGVIAGGRRLKALRALADEGHIARDKDVLCLIKPRAQAILTSAAENSGREAMSGPDTLAAFAAMVREGRGVEELALAFGVSEVTVRRRLKLATVSPRLFALYAQDDMTLDQLMSLALIDDPARQEAVWDGASEYQRGPAQLKRLALGTAVSVTTDRLARFVGVAAYTAAGGQLLGDLFADADAGYIADPELLARLAGDQLAAERARLLEGGAAWVDVVEQFDYTERQKYVEAPTTLREPTAREQKALAAARRALATAEEAMRAYQEADEADDDDERYARLEDAVDAAQSRVAELAGRLKVVTPEVQALCGVVLTIDAEGRLRTHRHLVRKSDAKKLAPSAQPESEEDDAEPGLSDALLRRLAAQRSVALQVEVARHPQVGLAVLAAALLADLGLAPRSYAFSSVGARRRERDLQQADASIDSGAAWSALAQLTDAATAPLPGDGDALLAWLLAQPQDVLVQLLALCAARSIHAHAGSLRAGRVDRVADAVGLDMTQYWSATGETYFRAVPKALIAQALGEVDAGKASEVEALKKGEAAALAEETVRGTGWLPPVLRRAAGGDAQGLESAD